MNRSTYMSQLVSDRWDEAVAEPTLQRWRNLAQFAAQVADDIEYNEPDSILSHAMRGVYRAAYTRMLALQPQEIAA